MPYYGTSKRINTHRHTHPIPGKVDESGTWATATLTVDGENLEEETHLGMFTMKLVLMVVVKSMVLFGRKSRAGK